MSMAPPEPSDSQDLLRQGALALGLELSPAAQEQFLLYLRELNLWNTRVNLTALKTDRDVVVKHFLDSLAVLPFLGRAGSLADLGSGAGFPGVALKLVRPEMRLTLVEAREKRAAFLEYLVAVLKLTEVEVVQAHLTPARARQWGPRFEVVVSRATFPLSRFLELAAPLLAPGGVALALKGPQLPGKELEAAQRRAGHLNLASLQLHPYKLPVTGEARLLVISRRRGQEAASP